MARGHYWFWLRRCQGLTDAGGLLCPWLSWYYSTTKGFSLGYRAPGTESHRNLTLTLKHWRMGIATH